MIFTRFQSLLNENPKNCLPTLKEHGQAECIKTEKIHGANFSVYLKNATKVKFATRNQVQPPEGNFFNFQRYFTEERIAQLQAWVNERPEGKTYRFIGELFGGHDAVGIKPVQKEIRYDGDIQFRVFHIETQKDGEETQHLPFDFVEGLCHHLGLEMAPVIERGPLAEIYQKDVEVASVLSSKGDIAEGFCYRLDFADKLGQAPIILKRRTEKFCEDKGKKGAFVDKALDPAVLDMFNKVIGMVTEQRVSNVNSHHGFSDLKDFPKLLGAVMEDLEKDAAQDYGVDKDAFKMVRKDLSRALVPLIKAEINK